MTSPETWEKIKRIFHEAREMEPDSRLEFARVECGNDSEVWAEVERLLLSLDDSEGFIEESILASSASYSGKKIGNYRIVREIGRGGMGVVLLADREGGEFEQQVAIKILKRGIDSDEIVKRFSQERQILASLNHPNIAALLDGGTTDDGLPYFVMEYVKGLPLIRYCSENSLTEEEKIRLFRDVCSAVSFSHGRLIVHRDLKPSNILVTKDGVPKLLDFGIAKVLGADADATRLTQTSNRLLTPEYASPEQISGSEITTSTDVYSLGVILYELLTGKLPYDFSTHSPSEIFRVIRDEEPVSPDKMTTTRVDGDLRNIVLMALRKEPERRYASVEKFDDDLFRYTQNLPVAARADTLRYRMTKFVHRNRVATIAATLIFLSLVTGIAVAAWQARLARQEADHARASQLRVEKINKFMQTMFSYANPDWFGRAGGRRDITVLDAMRDIERLIPTDFADDEELQADVFQQIGDVYRTQNLLEDAERNLLRALDIRKPIFGDDNAKVAESMFILSGVYDGLHRWDDSHRLLEQALEIQERHPNDTNNLPFMLADFGNYRLLTFGDIDGAITNHERALEMFRERYGQDYAMVSTMHATLSEDYFLNGDFERATLHGNEALTKNEVTGMLVLGKIAIKVGDIGKAESYAGRLATIVSAAPANSEISLTLTLLRSRIDLAKGDFRTVLSRLEHQPELTTKHEMSRVEIEKMRAKALLAGGNIDAAEKQIRSTIVSLDQLKQNTRVLNDLNVLLSSISSRIIVE